MAASAFTLLAICIPSLVQAAATYKIGDAKWLSLGAGFRTSLTAVENNAGRNNHAWSSDFTINNFRIYLNGQVHKYIKFELTTECAACEEEGDIVILDAIAKFELKDYPTVRQRNIYVCHIG